MESLSSLVWNTHGETYKLAFTPGLLTKVFQRPPSAPPLANPPPPEPLLPATLTDLLGGQGAEQGGYVDLDGDGRWWIPSGRVHYSGDPGDTGIQEKAEAVAHFYLPRRYRDPFGHDTTVGYDAYDLLLQETCDALANRVTVGERDAAGTLTRQGNDYRVLQPCIVTDPNRNRTRVAFDALGLVVATAVQGKDDSVGDTLAGLDPNPPPDRIDTFHNAADPHLPAPDLLQGATTRIVYDLERFQRTRQANPNQPDQWQPPYAATLARETHVSDPLPPWGLRIQIGFAYSDGFGREIQKKIQAEPEKANGVAGAPRWVGSGWTIFNNKGKPVRQYEPFFSQLPERRHHFEFGAAVGVSPILFYDPVGRVVATIHPNHTYEKVVFDPWQQTTWDVNDTLQAQPGYDPAQPDPAFNPVDDPDVGQYFGRLPADDYLPSWYGLRMDPDRARERWPNARARTAEQTAADKAVKHAATPTAAHLDSLGRPFVSLAHNGFAADGRAIRYPTRVDLDIEGNQRAVRDAIIQAGDPLGRIVMQYDYDLLGNRIHQRSMEAGARWMLNDVAGKPIRAWDSRGHDFTTRYDELRRPVGQTVRGTIASGESASDPRTLNRDILVDKIEYGEGLTDAEALNLRTRIYRYSDSAGIATKEL